MKWDLIIVGGGPGGLMAAKTAAQDGLKVLLIERKHDITKIRRACSHIFFINKLTASDKSEQGEPHVNGYVEPVSLEVREDRVRLHFLGPGFYLDYIGPIKPYYDWIQVSPSGYQIHRYDPKAHKIWAYHYSKAKLLGGLLSSTEKAGGQIWTDTICIGAENYNMGARIRIMRNGHEKTLIADKVIAADGINSRVIESLGLNKERPPIGKPLKISHYIVEGLEGLPPNSWISFTVPSITPWGTIPIGLWDDEAYQLEAGSMSSTPPHMYVDAFMKHPPVAPWFRHARVIDKLASTTTLRQPIRTPVFGNVLIAGDAGAPDATWIQGAIACGFQAVKAIQKEAAGKKGVQEYTNWWQQAFAFNRQDHFKIFDMAYSLTRLCSSEEIDQIYRLFQDKIGIPPCLVNRNMELIKEKLPQLYEKLTRGMNQATISKANKR